MSSTIAETAAAAAAAASTATATASVQQEEEKITLISTDGEAFEVAVAVAQQSRTLKHAIEDDCVAGGVPLSNVNSRTLSMVLEFMNAKHRRSEPEEFNKFEAEFLGKLDMTPLFEVILAANYLDATELLDAACQRVADMMQKLTVEEIRQTFGIENDFTPEEEEEVRMENAWAFD